jgi:hypothetical protein
VSFDAPVFQETQQLPAEKVSPHDSYRLDSSHAQVHKISHNVSGSSQTVLLRMDTPDRQAGLNRQLDVRCLKHPLGVQAEIAENCRFHLR